MAPEMSNPELLTSRAFPRWISIFGQCRHDEQKKPRRRLLHGESLARLGLTDVYCKQPASTVRIRQRI